MKKMNVIILIFISILFLSCNNKSASSSNENTTTTNENTKNEANTNQVVESENYQKLIIGSWYNYGTATGEDIVFNQDGTFNYHSGTNENTGKWKIEENTLNFFDTDYKIIELTKDKLVIEDKFGQTTYEKTQ